MPSFFLDRNALDLVERDGPDDKFEDVRFSEEAVPSPDAIFEGLRRHDQRDSLCYTVRPTHDPAGEDSPTLPRYGFVFVLFVRAGVGGFVVFDWEWREEDQDCPGHPANWINDFSRRTWHRTYEST